MDFRRRLKKYSDEFVMLSRNADRAFDYSPEHISKLLKAPEAFARFCGVSKFKPSDQTSLGILYDLIKDNSDVIRYEVALKLGNIKTNRSIELLTEVLGDACHYVRQAAVKSLCKISDESIIDELYPLISDRSHEFRLEAAKAIFRFEQDDPTQYIIDLLEDKSQQTRLSAIKFMKQHRREFQIHALPPLQEVAEKDRVDIVRKAARGTIEHYLDQGVLETIWDKIIAETDYYSLYDILYSVSLIENDKVPKIMENVLSYPFFLENVLDDEEEAEIKEMAVDFFIREYNNSKDASLLDSLFHNLLYNYRNSILRENIALALSKCGTDDVVRKAERILFEEDNVEFCFNLIRILCSIGSGTAIDVLCTFVELYSVDSDHIQDIFFYDGEDRELFELLSNSKNKKAHKLLAEFLEGDFYELSNVEIKTKCITAAGNSKAISTISNLSDILLNKDESLIIRRKAAQALGSIGTRKAFVALDKIRTDEYASNNLKEVAKSIRRTMNMAKRKHKVTATMVSHELQRAGSGIALDIFCNDAKLGNPLIGQGSMQWTGAKKKGSKRIDWTTFAQKMADEEYSGWITV